MITSLDRLLTEIKNKKLLEHKSSNVELKSGWDKKYGKKISALGNKLDNGFSWLVIGINNDGTLANKDEKWVIQTEEIISQQINEYLDPVQACIEMRCYEINKKWIIVIKIENPGTVVYWNRTAYKKSGTTVTDMKPEEIMQLTVTLPGLTDYSKQNWDGKIDKELSNKFVRNLLKKRNDLPFNYNDFDAINVFNHIKISRRNTIKILFGDCKYRIIFYDNNNDIAKNETKCGLYTVLMHNFINEIQDWSRSIINISEKPFPEQALKEGLANSVAHASYFQRNGDIIIEVFKDKVIISNLCLPECCYFANRWFSRSHKTVNELLMETLRLAGIVDELGRGKNLIFTDSIKSGKRPPQVFLEKAGRFNRWKLCIYGGSPDGIHLKLFKRIQNVYSNEQTALIAYALVLWKNLPVSTIRNYIDGESAPLFAEVLSDFNGPIYYYEKKDEIVLRRWVRILLEEGKDSKTFDIAEEEGLFDFAYDIQVEFHNGMVTPKILRKLAHMGETKSEKVLSSTLLKKWESEGKINKVKQGVYKFIKKFIDQTTFDKVLKILKEKQT